MDFLKRLVTNPLIMIFLAVIFAVPVTQAVVELHKGRNIQALDLLTDLTVTPFRNANLMHDLALKTATCADSIGAALAQPADPVSDRIDLLLDDALANVDDLKKAAVTKNRHVRLDSSRSAGSGLDSLSATLSAISEKVHSGAGQAVCAIELASVKASCASLAREFPHRSLLSLPLLAINDARYILWNDRYLRPYEKEMENSSVFAITSRPRMQFIRYLLFRDLGDKGVLGRRGWFFYRPDVDFLVKPYVRDPRSIVVDPNDRKLSDDPVAAIKKFKSQLDSRGIDLLMVIMPGKPSIYPDLVSSRAARSSPGTIGHSPDMLADLRKAGIDAVDLFTPFARERLNDAAAGDSLYLREDTHWKARAVRLAAAIVAARVKQYPWYRAGSREYAIDSVTVDRTGDVSVMTTLQAEKVHRFYGSFSPEKTKCYQVYRIERDSSGAVSGRILYKDEFGSSPILLLGDSFSRIYQTDQPRSAGWISHLAFELSQPLASLVNDGGASTLVRRSLAHNPGLLKGRKLVIWEVVERDFRFGEEGWKDVEIRSDKVTE